VKAHQARIVVDSVNATCEEGADPSKLVRRRIQARASRPVLSAWISTQVVSGRHWFEDVAILVVE